MYTFSFLGVMTLFSVGTILLKFKRPSLPREVTVSYGTTLVGITCVSHSAVVALFGVDAPVTLESLEILLISQGPTMGWVTIRNGTRLCMEISQKPTHS